jgi:hypothetical protein
MNLRRRSEAWMRAAWLPHQSCIRGSVSSSHAFSEIPPITTPFSGRSKPGKAHLAKPRQAPFERQDASCQREEVASAAPKRSSPPLAKARRPPPPTRRTAHGLRARNCTGSLELCAEMGAAGSYRWFFSWRRSHWRSVVAARRNDASERAHVGVTCVS